MDVEDVGTSRALEFDSSGSNATNETDDEDADEDLVGDDVVEVKFSGSNASRSKNGLTF